MILRVVHFWGQVVFFTSHFKYDMLEPRSAWNMRSRNDAGRDGSLGGKRKHMENIGEP